MTISFFIPGIPAPGGSKRGFIYRGRDGRQHVAMTDAAGQRNKNWRATCATVAAEAMAGKPMLEGPLLVIFSFVMPRPKAHFRTGKRAGELRDNPPLWHRSKPDALKLARSTEDALTGIVWRDDSQTASLSIEKRYTNIADRQAGCRVTIDEVTP